MRKISFLLMVVLTCLLVFAPKVMAAPLNIDNNLRLINTEYMADKSDVPVGLVQVTSGVRCSKKVEMQPQVATALLAMNKDLKQQDGYNQILLVSGYRDYAYQENLYNKKVRSFLASGNSRAKAEENAQRWVAPPGSSEHQSGLAVDILTVAYRGLNQGFAKTKEAQWLYANAWKYGFVLRYPENKTNLTKITYEPWHFRYVGMPHSQYIYENNLCLEEYWDLIKKQAVLINDAQTGIAYKVFYVKNANDLPTVFYHISTAGDGGYIVTCPVLPDGLWDVKGHWAETEINWLFPHGVTGGLFFPNSYMKKGEFVDALAGKDMQAKVDSPQDYLTRGSAAIVLGGFLPQYKGEIKYPLADIDSISQAANKYATTVVELGIMGRKDNKFMENTKLTKAESAVIIYRFFQQYSVQTNILPQKVDNNKVDQKQQLSFGQ